MHANEVRKNLKRNHKVNEIYFCTENNKGKTIWKNKIPLSGIGNSLLAAAMYAP